MGKARAAKRQGKPATGAAKGAVVLWAVLADGQMGNVLFPDMESARTEAHRLREAMPASTVEWAQVGVTLLMRRPMRPKIEVVHGVVGK